MSRAVRAALVPTAYGIGCIFAFALAYKLMGVERHFDITDEQKGRPWFASFYISVMAQSNALGDATPKTIAGRSMFGAQVFAGWMYFMVVAMIVAAYTR